jgi:hypothetical protein
VAYRLRNSTLYRDKSSVDGILWTYNPQKSYTRKVKALMNHLGPADLAPAVVPY